MQLKNQLTTRYNFIWVTLYLFLVLLLQLYFPILEPVNVSLHPFLLAPVRDRISLLTLERERKRNQFFDNRWS